MIHKGQSAIRSLVMTFMLINLLIPSVNSPASATFQQGNPCGVWEIAKPSQANDNRIEISMITKVSGDDCRGSVRLSDQTDVFGFGGYTFELTTNSRNAQLEWLHAADRSGVQYLLPPLDLEVHAMPINRAEGAAINIVGEMTSGSYVIDVALFLLRAGMEFIPARGCLITDEQFLFAAFRTSDIIAETASLSFKGDFVGARDELRQILDEFYRKAGEAFAEAGVNCAIDLVQFILQKPLTLVKISVHYLTWVPIAGFDYFKYQGSPASVSFAYMPAVAPTATSTLTPLPTNTPVPTATSIPEPISSLRGTVTQQSSCRYGPSQYHLYKTGFKPQAPVKIIGRDADGDWIQIELSGGNTPCWINASLVQVEGDVMALPDTYPIDRRLPISDAFPQITLISASPGGNGVTASWVHFEIREDLQQTDAVEYIIEVWTCVDRKPAFYAVGTDDTVASFPIDNSCGIASYAHLIGQDEHGFSFPTKIPLP